MRAARYLRDARHLEKGLYTLSDKLFYEPFEVHYEPSQEYFTLVANLLKTAGVEWVITRGGFWFDAHPKRHALPRQGWKVHISATAENGPSILKKAAKIALANQASFKFAVDKKVLSMMCSKNWHRGRSGKFITIYPSEFCCFVDLMEQLYEELRSEEGPYILSDKRYKDCRVLYYRFGGIEPTAQMDITGEKVLVLISPDGKPVPDIRSSYFSLPSWVADPFPAEKGQESEQEEEMTLHAGRYFIKKALAFSNSGGVYLAEDRHTRTDVVIKEARANTALEDRGDAIQRLKKEQAILELLRDTEIAPKPLDSFQDWENFFLAEEYMNGVDMRGLMLTKSPLMLIKPSLEDGIRFYEMFRSLFRNFAQALDLLHKNGIVLGDVSASNIKIDPSTYAVRLIDFEGACRSGVDEPTNLYTPGFKNPLNMNKGKQSPEDDLYGLAAIMFYVMFPIPVLASLRSDLFDIVLRTVLADIGWSQTEVFNIIRGLSKGEIPCTKVCELLDRPAQILAPVYNDDINAGTCDRISQELGQFILANMRAGGKGPLFPADPFLHQTNSLSFGFGACGVLYCLKKCGFEIPKCAYDWLEQRLDGVKPEDLPPGLFTGASGIAWTLWELGLEDHAVHLMKMANESTLKKAHHSYFYGMAGTGMANLFLHARTRAGSYLNAANDLADFLLKTAKENDRGIYWDTNKLVHLGYGYGQSGVALFFLRLFQVSGNEKVLSVGRRALEFDLSYGIEIEKGVLSFPQGLSDSTLLPYLEVGSAGIARVAIRYGIWDRMEEILSDVFRKYAGFAGLLFGLGSFVDILTDAFIFSNNTKFLEMAKRPIAGIRDIYLMKQLQGSATPGEGLFRISCDYATGVAGVLRALHRFTHRDEADFVLDEVGSAVGGLSDASIKNGLARRSEARKPGAEKNW